MRILTAAAATGAAVDNVYYIRPNRNQYYTYYVDGTFNGATVGLDVSPDRTGARWFNTGVAMTVAGVVNTEFQAARFRGTITTPGGSTSINADIL